METSISEINEDDLEISLIDGSLWRLNNVGDITKIALWYSPQRIKIKEYEGEYTLINLDTAAPDKVKVTRIV